MLQEEVTKLVTTEWAGAIVLALRKDGSLRLCADNRNSGDAMIHESYPLPIVDECIESLGDSRIF